MQRVSSDRVLRAKRESGLQGNRAPFLDNWQYHNGGLFRKSLYRPAMTQSHSLPQVFVEDVDLFALHGVPCFNINEDDLDCPGHDGTVSCRVSSQAFQDNDDELYCRGFMPSTSSLTDWPCNNNDEGSSESRFLQGPRNNNGEGCSDRDRPLTSSTFSQSPRNNNDEGCSERYGPLSYSSFSQGLCLNNNDNQEEHADCAVQLPCSSSSEGLYDSSVEEETAGCRGRAMSIDDISEDNRNNNNVTFLFPHSHVEDDDDDNNDDGQKRPVSGLVYGVLGNSKPLPLNSFIHEDDGDDEDDENDDRNTESEPNSGTTTPLVKDHLTPKATFFKLDRRASFDNGVFGLPDRIARGELVALGKDRNALTAPGTPAEPGTPVARCLSEEELIVDPEQVFKRIYNLLCAERVTQMTKTYNDIEAVTRLLEEKERDLELAARIGQTLLGKNKELASRGDNLDEQLTQANDKINQLKHDLSMKDELLKFYCQDLQEQSPGDYSPGDGATNLSKINVEMLQRKVHTLEEENLTLRLESAQLKSDTDSYEEKEKKLVEDCLQQLAEVNQQVETFAEELKHKTEESSRQKEEITSLLAQVADLHKRVRQLTIENMDLAEKLQASQESQKRLTKELSEQHDRYDELFEMLEEAQDELRGHRARGNPKATRHLYASAQFGSAGGGMDSLASELESSLQQEDQEHKDRRARSWKIFETARAARKAASKSSRDSSVRMSVSTSSLQDPNSQAPSQMPSNTNSDNESFSDGYSADMDSIYGSSSELGRPGIPGSNDLESALRRLAIRRANDLNERDFQMSQSEMRDESLGAFRIGDTPDSVSSPPSGYSYLSSGHVHHSPAFKIPDKLQIVKPLEGSVTLRHWQRLAQPHLGGLFERREGVKVRGERKLDLEGEVYTLSDFEEDEDLVECPSRRMADSSTIYTFTDSMVSRPSQFNTLQPSGSSASLQPMGSSTPQYSQSGMASKGSSVGTNTSSTYTMSLGLAAILQGREGSSVTRSLMRPVASCPVIPAESVATVAGGGAAGDSCAGADGGDQGPLPPNTPGLFGKLISTGYSLLWNKNDPPVSSASSPVASREGSPSDSGKPIQRKPSAEQILPKGGATGVLGAIATFRKNGIL